MGVHSTPLLKLPAFTAWVLLSPLLMTQAQQGGFKRETWMQAPPASTGIAIGQKIPTFQAFDQSGKLRDFDSIRGPKGAAIFFSRSVDW